MEIAQSCGYLNIPHENEQLTGQVEHHDR